MRSRAVWLAALGGLLLAAAAAPAPATDGSPDLGSVPAPLLAEFEPNVRDQLAGARAAVETAILEGRGEDATQALSQLCLLYLRYELMAAAEPCFVELRQLEPTDSQWPYYQSILYERDGLFERALASAETALRLGRDDLATRLRAANLHYRLKDDLGAERVYRRALDLDPTSSAALYGLGRIAAERAEPQAAAELFEQALAGQPEGSIVHHHLGMAYRALGDVDRARAELARSRRRPVSFPDPLYDRLNRLGVSREEVFEAGLEASRAGRPEGAARAFRKVLENAPDDADAHFNLARSLIELEDLAAAETHFRRAIEIRSYPSAHFNLSILYGRTGRLDEAATQLDRAVATDPENLEWRVLQARSIAQRGDLEGAIDRLNQIIALDPGLPDAPRALGAMLAATANHVRAVSVYRDLVTLVPGDAEGRVGLALSLLRVHDYGEARTSLEGSLAVLPQDVTLRHLLARLLASCPDAELRDGQRSFRLAEEVVATQLTLDHAETLAMALAELGRFEEATSWQQRVIQELRRSGRSPTAPLRTRLDLYLARRPYHAPWDL